MNPTTDPIFTSLLNENSYNSSRKNLIKLIENKLGGTVVTYIENSEHPFASIINQDAVYFADLLQSIQTKKGFLILNSNGGSGNAAEKLLSMCRKKFTESFTIIVPNFAKSAATMMCLGADKIMMGYLAELGPIDPQINAGSGQSVPARSFIDGLEMIRENVTKHGDPANMYLSMLSQVRPEIIAICQAAIEDARSFAENWLSQYMLKKDPTHAKNVSEWLSDGKTYKSHGKVIDHVEAKNTLKLNIESINPDSELWYWIWELYVRSIHFLHSKPTAAKLYESNHTSLMMNINVNQLQQG